MKGYRPRKIRMSNNAKHYFANECPTQRIVGRNSNPTYGVVTSAARTTTNVTIEVSEGVVTRVSSETDLLRRRGGGLRLNVKGKILTPPSLLK